MGTTTLRDMTINTGDLPAVGSSAPDFSLLSTSLQRVSLGDYAGKRKVLNIFPSIDTPVCQASVRHFNEKAAGRGDTVVLNISYDLPFAHKRFCGAEGLTGVESLSAFKSTFGSDYGADMANGPLAGLCSRAVVVLDADNRVLYTEQVPSIGQEPDYDAALGALS